MHLGGEVPLHGRRRRADRLGDPRARAHRRDRGRRRLPRAGQGAAGRGDPRVDRSAWRRISSTPPRARASLPERPAAAGPPSPIGQAIPRQGGRRRHEHHNPQRPDGRGRRPRRRRPPSASGAPAAQAAPTYTPEAGASLRLLRWVPFVTGEEEAWNANTAAFTEATGVAGADRPGELGGRAPEGRGRRQRRLGARHGDELVRRPVPVSRQARRRDRARHRARRGERRLVRRAEGLCGPRRQVHRHAALRHRQRDLLPRQPHEGRGLQRVPEGHRRVPRALQGDARPRARPRASRTARRSATATTTRTGCSGATAAR